jgi:voltage-gated potassium channel
VTVRERTYRALNPQVGLTRTSRALIYLILFATVVTVLETEPSLLQGREQLFGIFEVAFALLFGIEYAFRIWSACEGPCSRWRYALSPASLVDLVALIGSVLTLAGLNVELLRLLRLLRLAKLARYWPALDIMARAIRSRASHLAASLSLALVFMLVSATIMYWVEGGIQPERFGSIPRALWWSVATMTTVGYGDVVPQTNVGQLLAGLIAMSGIVLVAIPTGIMAAAFSDELHKEPGRDHHDDRG